MMYMMNSTQDKKILIVDDSGSMRGLLCGILTGAGYTKISTAASGEEAIALFHKTHPDLVLLDIIMSGMNGMDVLREIGAKTKVMMLSAVGQDSIINEARKIGAIDFITKPLNNEEVITKVSQYLK